MKVSPFLNILDFLQWNIFASFWELLRMMLLELLDDLNGWLLVTSVSLFESNTSVGWGQFLVIEPTSFCEQYAKKRTRTDMIKERLIMRKKD